MSGAVPSEVLKVDVWSDVACPWCYVGKRRFEEALRRYADAGGTRRVEVEYRSFLLAPGTPVEVDLSAVEFLAQHLRVPLAQARQMTESMTSTAASVGLAFDYDALQQTSTRKAHELLHLAKERGVQGELKERLLRAHFAEGRHVGRDEELADLAEEVGLDRQEVLEALGDSRYAAAVDDDLRQAAAYGITGVPFFVIDGRLGVSGAQDPAVLADALRQAAGDVLRSA